MFRHWRNLTWIKILTSIAASSLLVGPAIAKPTPGYTITDLGTLGGTYSYGFGINNLGVATGGAATPTQTGGVAETAFLWYRRHITDLGTLGGLACPGCNSEAGPANVWGAVTIISDTSRNDPNGEDFCAFGTHLQCLGAIWRNGILTPLPTLSGGNNASAFDINDEGEVVGSSENGTKDGTCSSGTSFQALRYEPVTWGPNGKINELRPPGADTVGFAFGINDSGEVVGSTGLCSNTTLPPVAPAGQHAVLWDKHGSPMDLGQLEGPPNVATSVNNRDEVVGTSESSDGTLHAFLWTKHTGMQDLGGFPGAIATVPPCCNTINDSGEVVGFSIDASFNFTALVWQGKVPVDLNTLIPAGSPWYLQAAESVNDLGQIVGYGLINGKIHAFLATPN
jgi:probable HAF family extracellular repeat protein